MSCPCGSSKSSASCCDVYLSQGKTAPTAEALMRSRYTAFVKGDIDYLMETHDPSTRGDVSRDGIEAWSKESEWRGLEIRSVEEGGEGDITGRVEFVAKYRHGGESVDHHEVAKFRKVGGRWLFLDGKLVGGQPTKREADKVGRNDPCSCGSGKKFKKCCGT